MRKKILIAVLSVLLMILSNTAYSKIIETKKLEDFDPLVDTTVTVEIKQIRFLEDKGLGPSSKAITGTWFNMLPEFLQNLLSKRNKIETENANANPSLYVEVYINDIKSTSDIWEDQRYIYDISWKVTLDVPDDEEFVDIKIQLWDDLSNTLFDISGDSGTTEDGYDVELKYSIKTGRWTGDDELSDQSGYGRLCGCDDGTIYTKDQDSELWFNIYQNDYDDDGIPYWAELNKYGTDPESKNSGDPDGDGIPVSWEWKWGYNPFSSENHNLLDSDGDSINNFEEYLTKEGFSDPFRKDVFIELDIMEEGPEGQVTRFPLSAKELMTTSFNRQNILLNIDYNTMGGTDSIPFGHKIGYRDLNDIYKDYFLHNDNNNWRRGVFHYGLVVYSTEGAAGYMYRPNAFQISSSGHELIINEEGIDEDIVYGSAYMHELGHTFDFWPIPGHDRNQGPIEWLINTRYRSCMNYCWMYKFVDYSDGTHGGVDIDDWERIDYSAFEREW